MPWQKCHQSTLYLLIVEDVIADVELMVIALEAACITTYDTTDSLITCQQLLQAKPIMLCWQTIACLSSRLTKC